MQIVLYTVGGVKVAELRQKNLAVGVNKLEFKTNGLKPGVYIYQVTTDAGVLRQKVMIN